jgi:hypothetical protein
MRAVPRAAQQISARATVWMIPNDFGLLRSRPVFTRKGRNAAVRHLAESGDLAARSGRPARTGCVARLAYVFAIDFMITDGFVKYAENPPSSWAMPAPSVDNSKK